MFVFNRDVHDVQDNRGQTHRSAPTNYYHLVGANPCVRPVEYFSIYNIYHDYGAILTRADT